MSVPFLSYDTEPYDVSFSISKTHTRIKMTVPTNLLNTRQIPTVHKTLNKLLPSIFESTCYNEFDLPFSEEVKKTETAHLFEHIFLEYLAQHDTRKPHKKKVYKGVTSWDWRKDPRGSFYIELNVGTKEMLFLSPALEKTIQLFSHIVNATNRPVN